MQGKDCMSFLYLVITLIKAQTHFFCGWYIISIPATLPQAASVSCPLCTFETHWPPALEVSTLLPALTLLFVHSDDDHAFIATYADELVDGADTSTWQLTQEDHALDVVVLQKADIGAHLGDGPHVHHHYILHLWEPVLVKSTAEPRHRWKKRTKWDVKHLKQAVLSQILLKWDMSVSNIFISLHILKSIPQPVETSVWWVLCFWMELSKMRENTSLMPVMWQLCSIVLPYGDGRPKLETKS